MVTTARRFLVRFDGSQAAYRLRLYSRVGSKKTSIGWGRLSWISGILTGLRVSVLFALPRTVSSSLRLLPAKES
jgi:hypothetical protein